MSFAHKLKIAFIIAIVAMFAASGLGPVIADLIQIVNANLIVSAAVGLPILTTATLLIALFALQR